MKILKFTIAFVVFSMALHSCDTSSIKQKTAEELKEELKVQEQIAPTQYLSVKATLRENITQQPDLFHHTKTDGYLLSGSVKNSSTLAKFKDVVVLVMYLSETETEMDSKEYIIYKFFNPSGVTDFEYKVYPPSGFKNFSIQVKTAASAN